MLIIALYKKETALGRALETLPLIYHITHSRNLPSILQQGGLLCDATAANLNPIGIAHANIKQRRANRRVTLGPGGALCDYVPFYFAPRSPMLCAIHNGRVEDYTEGQSPILHLVSSTELVAQSNSAFVFTDGHAEIEISEFFADLESLDKVDWDIMEAKYWRDTLADSDRKRRRQAEFLVHNLFPWTLITKIGVINQSCANEINLLLESGAHRPDVAVERRWYY